MKIFRLSLFNIRKHKVETASVFFLILLCVTMLASSISGMFGLDTIVDKAYEKTNCYHNFVNIPKDHFKAEYLELFENDERVTDYGATHYSHGLATKYINKSGKEISQELIFTSPETEKIVQDIILDSPYTLDEITAMEHFIIMPYFVHDTLKYNVGDTFEVLYNEKVYPFEIAGFYEATFFCDAEGFRSIVSDDDLVTMESLLGSKIFIGFDTETDDAASDFIDDFNKYVEENSNTNAAGEISAITYKNQRFANTMRVKLIMVIMAVMAAVVFASIVFMIRFRIKGDIDEQMVSIGVLESLGYRSGEIALSYVYEYLLISIPAAVVGLLISLGTGPALFRVGEIYLGHRGGARSETCLPAVFAAVIVLLVVLISYFRSRRIKKIPPVVAFRKGTETHSHNKNVLPLEKAKGNIHLRLAAKGYLSNMKQNIGMGLCISLAAIACIVCFVISDLAANSHNAIGPLCGVDIPEISVIVTAGTDTDELISDIKEMDGVKKVIPTNVFFEETANTGSTYINMFVYDDFDSLEGIFLKQGRLPKHDNEVAVKSIALTGTGKKLGDTITLEYGKVKADYTICGIISTPFSLGYTTYITTEGYQKLNPTYQHMQLDIFLEKDVEIAAFKKQLNSRYGIMDRDTRDAMETNENASLEERIRTEADMKISDLLELHGVNSIDYAINIDGHIIKGNSSKFKITYGLSVYEMADNLLVSQMRGLKIGTGIFMVVSAFVIAIVVFLVVYSAVKKQRMEFGIMKGMGYTSKELMLQTSLKILPTLIISVLVGGGVALLVGQIFYSAIGGASVIIGKILIVSIAVVVFGFAVAYFAARKIKNISVYELMQE